MKIKIKESNAIKQVTLTLESFLDPKKYNLRVLAKEIVHELKLASLNLK